MADDIIPAPAQAANGITEIPADIQEQMRIALDPNFQPAEDAGNNGQQQQQVADVGTTQVEPFKFETFTEKFGWVKPEDAELEITELRALKANPPAATPLEIQFEGEHNKKLFEALKTGKIDDVYEFLDQQRKLDKYLTNEVTDTTAGDIIKLGLKLNYKDLTDAEIEYKYNKSYSLPKELVQAVTEEDDAFAERKDEWKERCEDIKMSKIIDAKTVRPQLEAAKQKLVLPDIESAGDSNYQKFLQYQKDLEKEQQEDARIDAETQTAYRSFTPEQVELKVPYKDEQNKIDFEFQFKPDPEGFAKTLEMVIDPKKLFSSYKNSDGSPNRKKFLEDMYFAQNREKIITEAINQSKNATIKAQLPDNTGQTMFNRQISNNQPVLTELDKQMQAAGIVPNR